MRKVNPHDWRRSEGFSIVEILVAMVVVSIVVAVGYQFYDNKAKEGSSLQAKMDLESLRYEIAARIDCDETFKEAGIDPDNREAMCPSRSTAIKPPYLRLMVGEGRPLGGELSPTKGMQKVGPWHIQVVCSESEQTLIVRAAKIVYRNGVGYYARNPLTKKSEKLERNILFGGHSTGIPLCFSERDKVSEIRIAEAILTNVSGGPEPRLRVVRDPNGDAFIHLTSWPGGSLYVPGLDLTKMRGIRCDRSKGWKVIGCTHGLAWGTGADQPDPDIVGVEDGCMSPDFAEGPTELRVLCIN